MIYAVRPHENPFNVVDKLVLQHVRLEPQEQLAVGRFDDFIAETPRQD